MKRRANAGGKKPDRLLAALRAAHTDGPPPDVALRRSPIEKAIARRADFDAPLRAALAEIARQRTEIAGLRNENAELHNQNTALRNEIAARGAGAGIDADGPVMTRAKILAEICAKHGVTRVMLRGPQRFQTLARARQEAMYRMRVETASSLPAIGQFLNRDPATVLHGSESHAKRHGLPRPWRDGQGSAS